MRFRADVSIADTDYGQVLLDEQTGRYWQLNPTGAFVVKHLLDGDDENKTADALIGAFKVDESQARRDVAALVASLQTAGLVTT